MGRVAPPLPCLPGQSVTFAQLDHQTRQAERQLRQTRVLLSAVRLGSACGFACLAAALLLNRPG